MILDGTKEDEMRIMDELNLVRENPKAYFDNYISGRMEYINQEGYNSLAEDVKNVEYLGKLVWKESLYRISKEHSTTQGPTGETGHVRANGAIWEDIVKKYGKSKFYGENISYAMNTPRTIVIQLLLDNNISGRGHRRNIFDPRFNCVGCSFDDHKFYRYLSVINFAKDWVDR